MGQVAQPRRADARGGGGSDHAALDTVMVDRSATSQRVASAAAPPSTGPRKVTWAGTPEAALVRK